MIESLSDIHDCFNTELRTFSKSLAEAIRQQNASARQSLCSLEESFENLYSFDQTKTVVYSLTLQSQRIRHRCVLQNKTIWKVALSLLEQLATKRETEILLGEAIVPDAAHMVNVSLAEYPILENEASQDDLGDAHILDAINDIFSRQGPMNNGPWSFLLVESEGNSAKTLLDEIQRKARSNGIEVVRPSLPFDAIGATIGASEDALISMVTYALSQTSPCILVLEDIDCVCEGPVESSLQGESSSGIPHLTSRVHSILLSLLAVIEKKGSSQSAVARTIIICSCTSKNSLTRSIVRFDRIFHVRPPNDQERNSIISACLGDQVPVQACDQDALDGLVRCTAGQSWSELAQLCQNSISFQHTLHLRGIDDMPHILQILKQKLQSSIPESLRNGVNEESVDIKVFASRELQKLFNIRNLEDPIQDLPLYGENARRAWDELHRLIVLPICRGDTLDKIMFDRNSCGIGGRKVFAGGVLIAAGPGTGKSTLAYFCAAFSSCLNQCVKLIDISCTSLIHKEVGGSERALHRVFQIAKEAAPCIVVMEGIDNIAAVRGNDNTTEGTIDRLLSTLLTELDGVDNQPATRSDSTSSMALIGITHDSSWIDPALCRPGRLGRIIGLENPEMEARKQIVLRELSNVPFSEEHGHPEIETVQDIAEIVAKATMGLTGAELIGICNEAKLLASKAFLSPSIEAQQPTITPSLLFQSLDTQRAANGG